MKLYLVRGQDINEMNSDLFVTAPDADAAVDIWNDHCVVNGWPRHDDDDDETLPRSKSFDPQNVRLILEDVTGTPYAGAAHGIDWEALPIEFEA